MSSQALGPTSPTSTMEPQLRQKHQAKDHQKEKGFRYASQRHIRIELENQYRHAKRLSKLSACSAQGTQAGSRP